MTAIARIPTAIDQIDTGWFDSVLDRPVADARILNVIHGTATKVQAELTYGDGTAPQVVWVKTGLEPHSHSIGNDQVYAGETFFYRTLGGKYETRTPACLFADTDAQGNSALVLDDLCKLGARFADPVQGGSIDMVASGLRAIARYQAASWMAPELGEIGWLRNGGSYRAADVLDWVWNVEHWRDYSSRPRFALVDPSIRDRDLLFRVHSKLQDEFWPRAPWALCHGDAHFGQVYALPDGEVRLLDWQCVQVAHWAHDVSYFMVSGLSVADRRAAARDLIAGYVAALREFGVADAPDADAAWEAFCAYAFHGIGWMMCLVEMQDEETCCAMAERFSAAVVDLGSIDLILNGSPS